MKRVVMVSREVFPFTGGGIAPIVTAAARALRSVAEVTVLTTGRHRERHAELAGGDPELLAGMRFIFVDEPAEHLPWFSPMHAYSARVFEALCDAFPEGGPDLIEFCDYLGEGFVTTQARHTRDPRIRNALVCVRLHTTAELCSVLDGHVRDDFATVATFDAERFVLEHADRILWSGGDVLGTYQRYYGTERLAAAVRIPDAFLGEAVDATVREREPGEPLRFLFLGRMERRKGVQNLVRAAAAIDRAFAWTLTLVGGDTDTAPLQQPLKEQLRLMAGDDPRIRFAPVVARDRVGQVIRDHDVVVAPSLWECWPNVVREAFQHNRPVLATPVGGMVEMVRPGVSGWLAADTSVEALTQALERVLERPDEPADLSRREGPVGVFSELADPDPFVAAYARLLERVAPSPPRRRRPRPLVSVVVPYFELDAHVEETVRSIADQTYAALEIIVVNDGSVRPRDAMLQGLAERYGARIFTQVNSGLGQARNFGVAQSRGHYVLPVDADDTIAPTLVERCVDVLEADPRLAYVTSWARFVADDGTPLEEPAGYFPYGNWSRLIERNNVGGTCTALLRRRLFEDHAYSPDLTSYEDWFLYRQLARSGHVGAVIPERLFVYRVRADSMMREVALPRVELLMDEMRGLELEAGTTWTAPVPRARA